MGCLFLVGQWVNTGKHWYLRGVQLTAERNNTNALCMDFFFFEVVQEIILRNCHVFGCSCATTPADEHRNLLR